MPARNHIPSKPTSWERATLERYLELPDWQFDMIKDKCFEADSHYVDWNNETQAIIYAKVYVLPAIKTGTKLQCVANYFIRYQNRVYQSLSLHDIVELLNLLLKERIYNDYIDREEKPDREMKE